MPWKNGLMLCSAVWNFSAFSVMLPNQNTKYIHCSAENCSWDLIFTADLPSVTSLSFSTSLVKIFTLLLPSKQDKVTVFLTETTVAVLPLDTINFWSWTPLLPVPGEHLSCLRPRWRCLSQPLSPQALSSLLCQHRHPHWHSFLWRLATRNTCPCF